MRRHLSTEMGDAISVKQPSATNGPRRKASGRDTTWLSSSMIQSSVPTHVAIFRPARSRFPQPRF